MRIVRFIIILILVALGIITALILVLPVKQHAESRIAVQASAHELFAYLRKSANAKDWLASGTHDSLRISTSGSNGTTGDGVSWTSSASKGQLTISTLKEDAGIEWTGQVMYPQQQDIEISFKLKENNGSTILEMEYDVLTPRPHNLFAIFKGIDPAIQRQLDQAVQRIAKKINKQQATAPAPVFDIQPVNFPSTSYLLVKKENMPPDSISTWAAQQHSFLYDQLVAASEEPGRPVILLPEKNSSNPTSVSAGITVSAATRTTAIPNAELLSIPASKALELIYTGDDDGLEAARNALRNFRDSSGLADKGFFIEEQLAGGSKNRAHTRIILLLE